jgi:hypothetical protein
VIDFHLTPPAVRAVISNKGRRGLQFLLRSQRKAGRFFCLGDLQMIFAFE